VNYFYWDASALAKRYAPESGTPLVNYLFANVSLNKMMCLNIGTGEVISIFVRKRNAGIIPDVAFSQAMIDFRAEVIDSADFRLAAVTDALVFASHLLIERYSLNATDALILRSTLDIAVMRRQEGDDIVLLSSDHRLLSAAQREGLKTFNPETDSQVQLDAFLSVTS
jgi:predicted nucleic acid-binding protein